jgi:hypothetical protein
MNWFRSVRRWAAIAVVTAGAVGVGIFAAVSPAEALPNNGSASCYYLWNMSGTYAELALQHPQTSTSYAIYMSISNQYLELFASAGC